MCLGTKEKKGAKKKKKKTPHLIHCGPHNPEGHYCIFLWWIDIIVFVISSLSHLVHDGWCNTAIWNYDHNSTYQATLSHGNHVSVFGFIFFEVGV